MTPPEDLRHRLRRRIEDLSQADRAKLRAKLDRKRDEVVRLGHREGPLSFSQQRQWILDQLDPGNPTYNSPVAVRLRGRFDVSAFQAALDQLVLEHEILRTGFHRDKASGAPRQTVANPSAVPFVLRDVTPDALGDELREATNQRFDLARPPLVRAWVFRLAPEEHAVLVVMHHIVSDGWSLGIFVRELVDRYAGRPGAPPAVQYLDYVHWERARAGRQGFADLLGWWREELSGAPLGRFLPLDRARPAIESHRGGTLRLEVEPALVERIQRAAKARGATPFVMFLAALAALLSRWSSATQFLLGSPVANRPHPELEELIGLFVNTLILRMDVTGDPTLAELVDRAHRTVERALTHQGLPFEKLVEGLNPDRLKAHDALFQVMVTYFNEPTRRHLDFPGLSWAPIEFDRKHAYRDLTVRMGDLQGRFLVDIEYRADLFDAATIAALGATLRASLAAIVDEPGRRVGELELPPELQRRRRAAPAWADAGRSRLTAAKRSPGATADPVRPVHLSAAEWPLVLGPGEPGVDLAGWARKHRARVDALLLAHGAILWRGFGIDSPGALRRVIEALDEAIIQDYADPSTPRRELGDGVFTSTEYPADQTIKLHNECAYTTTWPRRLAFACVRPAERGGATTIGDMRTVFRRLDPTVRAEFARRGVTYVRNYHPGVDLPWQHVYRTEDPREVERIEALAGARVVWRADGGLTTHRRLPALSVHRETGDPIWFNSAHMFHVAGLRPAARDSLRKVFGANLPRHALYGDGGEIPDAVIEHICDVYAAHTRPVRWVAGDLLLIDNQLTLHGREPFEGVRSVLVMMTGSEKTLVGAP